jgi:hypothetical protein
MHRDSHRITKFYDKTKALARRAFSGCPGAAHERIALAHETSSEMPLRLKRSAKLSRRGVLVNNCSFINWHARLGLFACCDVFASVGVSFFPEVLSPG